MRTEAADGHMKWWELGREEGRERVDAKREGKGGNKGLGEVVVRVGRSLRRCWWKGMKEI